MAYDCADFKPSNEDLRNLIVDRAQNALMTNGWAQGTGHDKNGGRCLLNVLADTIWKLNKEFNVKVDQDVAFRVIQQRVCPGRVLFNWNDEVGRTLDDVLAALDTLRIPLDQEERASIKFAFYGVADLEVVA